VGQQSAITRAWSSAKTVSGNTIKMSVARRHEYQPPAVSHLLVRQTGLMRQPSWGAVVDESGGAKTDHGSGGIVPLRAA